MSRKDLEKILDEHYARYTVRSFSDFKKAGAIEIYLPGESVSMAFGWKLDMLKPAALIVTAHKLPWWRNRITRKKWLVV